jgi:DNA modification methylase
LDPFNTNEIAAIWVPIEDLKPWKENPRKNDGAVKDVADSIRRFGFGAPLVARLADKQIIAGHTRLLAAKQLKLTTVPVRFLDLDPVDAQLLALADNKLGEIAEWDENALARLLNDLRAQGADIQASGFDSNEIDQLIAELNSGTLAGVIEPPVPDLPEIPQSCVGEIYMLGPHRLMCGDSTSADDVARLMKDERASLCATDPPYLVDYDGGNHPQSFERQRSGKTNNKHWDDYKDPETSIEFFSTFIRVALAHALVENPAWYQWHASRRQALVEEAWKANGLLLHQQLIWVKSRPILTRSHFMWQHEPCFYGWVEGSPPALRPSASGECTTIWTIDGEQDGIHPTQKPLEIFERPITYHTRAGEIVYEPFSGSGSQMIAAAKTGRRCYAMELAPAFVDVARIRWTNFARVAGIDPGPGALMEKQPTGSGR